MTDDSATGLERLIAAAQAGDRDALNQLLDRHKDWLRLIAAGKLRRDVRARVGDSDLVNETLLSAFKGFAKFKGNKTVEFQVWLKRIFDRNLHDTIRFHVDAVRRSVDMEHTHLADEPLDFSDDDISPSEAVLLGEDACFWRRLSSRCPKTSESPCECGTSKNFRWMKSNNNLVGRAKPVPG